MRKRVFHVLRTQKYGARPDYICYFDSEARVDTELLPDDIRHLMNGGGSIERPHDTYLICATFSGPSGSVSHAFYGQDFKREFAETLDSFHVGKSLYLFAHNAKYDVLATGLIYQLCVLGWRVSMFADDNPFIIELRHAETKRKIIILSTTNYFQCSLASLGETVGLEKLEAAYNATLDKAIDYCLRDVEIVRVAVERLIRFVETENLGPFRRTVASLAFSAYRNCFMVEKLYIHNNPAALAVERRAYAGGRVEAFRLGRIPESTYYVDINSMYPYVMQSQHYPTKLISFWKRAGTDTVLELIAKGYLICADCVVDTDVPIYPFRGLKLEFPIGRFETALSTPEIEEGIQRGIIREFRNVAIYESANIFADYVDYFYQKRLSAKADGDKVSEYFFKILLNSLYGKFGQRAERWEKIADADIAECRVMSVNGWKNVKVFGGGEWMIAGKGEEAFDSFPAIAAHVTAYARMLLWRYMEIAGRENVYYCDTDSLFVNRDGYTRLQAVIDPDKLGYLKLEGISSSVTIRGCKDYDFGGTTKTKGVSKSAISLQALVNAGRLSIDEIPEKFHDELANYYVSTRWGGIPTFLRAGNIGSYRNELFVKHMSRVYDKGVVDDSGLVTPKVLL